MFQQALRALRSSAVPYLTLLVVMIIGGQLLQYGYRGSAAFKGQSAGILFVLAVCVLALAAWLLVQPFRPMARFPALIFIGMLALWLIATLRIVSEHGAFNYTAFVTPVVLVMLIVKPPNSREALRFGDIVAVGLTLSILATQLLDILDVRANRVDIVSRGSLPIPGFSIPARWEGMFTDPNLAGFIGAFLLVYGLRRRRWLRVWLIVVGVLVVVLSESRSALVAIVAGAATVFLTSAWLRSRNLPQWAAPIMAVGGAVVVIAGVLIVDPTFNGRTSIWQSMLELSTKNPAFGVGSNGMLEASQRAEIPWGNVDGHSILLDPLARNGIVAGLIATLVLIAGLVLTYRARTTDSGMSLAVMVTFLAGGLTYTVTTWQYPTTQILPLLVALLGAQAAVRLLDERRASAPMT